MARAKDLVRGNTISFEAFAKVLKVTPVPGGTKVRASLFELSQS